MMRVLLLLLMFLVGFTAAWGQISLATRLDELLKEHLPQGSEVGIAVYDLTAGESLYAYRQDKLCRPASTMKLLTAITALAYPGGTDPFYTEVWYKGVVQQDTLHGDLYVVGGFDPEFGEEKLDALIKQVINAPFSVVTGKILGDVSMKDSLYWGSGWAWDDTPASYQPYLSPLMLCKDVVSVTAIPSTKRGDRAQVSCVPNSSYYSVTNITQTRTPSAGKFSVSRSWLNNTNDIIIQGSVEKEQSGEVNVYSSSNFFMHTLAERLCARGLAVGSDYAFSELICDTISVRIARVETPIQCVLNQLMKESDNLNAEALLCRIGVQATGKKRISASDGLWEINQMIAQLGYDASNYKIADGCGLSNYNYVSPALLVDFLRFAYLRTDIFEQLYPSLPIAGVDGTLRYRMQKGNKGYANVHAKTGSLTAINALAGYLKAGNGHDIAFAIMNQNALSVSKSREFQNKVCEVLCE